MAMTLSDYRTRLTDLSGVDLNLNEDRLNRIVNDAYLELAAAADWWWLETYEVLRFSAPVTTKSFVCNVGTADMTPLATADQVTTAYVFGWAATGEHTYRISAVATATPYALTLDAKWIEASGTYAIALWNDALPIATACDIPVALLPRNDPNTTPPRFTTQREIETHGPDVSDYATEIANMYTTYREPIYRSSQLALRVFPPPDEVCEYVFRYKQTATAMGDDTATTLIPPKFENCLIAAAQLKYLKLNREDPDLISNFELEFQKALMIMRQTQNRSSSIIRRMGRRGTTHEERMLFKLTNVEEGGI